MAMTQDEYLKAREFYQMRGQEELAKGDIAECDYMVGVVRGLDLAMGVSYEMKEKVQ